MDNVQTNSAISVDCAIFGFDGTNLKTLLVRRRATDPLYHEKELKLPGGMIRENETLPEAASRISEGATGLKDLYLKQTTIFSDPHRVDTDELKWICQYHRINTDRVVTVGYYALVKLDQGMLSYTRRQGAVWMNVDDIHYLIMDHMDILSDALSVLQRDILWSPVAFKLMPRKFTVRQLQNLLEAVFGIEIDNRNFRKKLFTSGILVETEEMEKNVNHKPARLYTLNKSAFGKKSGRMDIVNLSLFSGLVSVRK
ncbi:MAG: NUDIX hydrolase [Bacteroidales bacterium]|nr:NUDIX hydrolase [Bacteroidales bacterium]